MNQRINLANTSPQMLALLREYLLQIGREKRAAENDPTSDAWKAQNFVKNHLRSQVDENLKNAGVTEDILQAFLDSKSKNLKETALWDILSKSDSLHISTRKTEVLMKLWRVSSHESVLKEIQDYLLHKQCGVFRRKSGLSEATWANFYNNKTYTSEDTAVKISNAVGCSVEDFLALTSKKYVKLTPAFRQELNSRLQKKNVSTKAFCDLLCFCPNTLKVLTSGEEGTIIDMTTLLKLCFGFRLSETEAKNFLALVHTCFASDRDLLIQLMLRDANVYTTNNPYTGETEVNTLYVNTVLEGLGFPPLFNT